MARYGIATVFGDYPQNYEFTEKDTPLHLTHVDMLEIDLDQQEFINKMTLYFQSQPRFSIMPIAVEHYGPNKDIPVTILELNPELKVFHKQLVRFLESQGAVFANPHFLNDQYQPHISIYGPRSVEIGQPLIVKDVSIGNKQSDVENPPNRLIAKISLL